MCILCAWQVNPGHPRPPGTASPRPSGACTASGRQPPWKHSYGQAKIVTAVHDHASLAYVPYLPMHLTPPPSPDRSAPPSITIANAETTAATSTRNSNNCNCLPPQFQQRSEHCSSTQQQQPPPPPPQSYRPSAYYGYGQQKQQPSPPLILPARLQPQQQQYISPFPFRQLRHRRCREG